MKQRKPWWLKAWEMIVPPMTDFHALLGEQAENLEAASKALQEYLEENDPALAAPVKEHVRAGHQLRQRNLALLHKNFITPIDREDIYTLAMNIDHILDYLKNTVREVEVLQVEPDHWMQKMAEQLSIGAGVLRQGLKLLQDGMADQVPSSMTTHHQERHIEALYRDALAAMFGGEEYRLLSESSSDPSGRECLQFVISRIKRREVYRHLSNAADRLDHAGEALRDISVKYE